jgi:hypothetical protein
MADLKLSKLPDRAPVRITLSFSPELFHDLNDYAAVYEEAYGERESVAELIPFMLSKFLASDRAFTRSRKGKSK